MTSPLSNHHATVFPARDEQEVPFHMNQMCLCMCAGYAQPGVTEDDILLELVMFMGVVCNEATAPQLIQTGLVGPNLHITQSALACMLHDHVTVAEHCL